MVNPDPGQKIRFEVLCQGKNKFTSYTAPPNDLSDYGTAYDIWLFASGYSEDWGFGRSFVSGGILHKDEIEPLIKQFRRPVDWNRK